MEFHCPIKCTHNSTHPWGSLAFCDTFRAKDLPIKRDLVKKARVCVNYLKTNNHTALRPCRAQPCFNCKASQHTLLCPKGPNGHALLAEIDKDKEEDQDPDNDKDDVGDDKDEIQGDDSQVFMASYEEEHDYLDDFEPEDEDLYDIEDSPNEVDVGIDYLSQILFKNTMEDRESKVKSNAELVPINLEEVEETALIQEPEEAIKNKEVISDEMLKEELSLMYKEEKVEKDRIKESYMNNNLTESNKVDLKKWVLKFDSFKKEKISLNSFTKRINLLW